VLEAGCGIGQWVFQLGSFGYEAHGIDITPSPLLKAVDYARKLQQPYPFLEGDLRNIPYRTGTFDVIVSFGVIEHFKDSLDAVGELFRVLRLIRI
jgi:SAM-dependent methyltransferase